MAQTRYELKLSDGQVVTWTGADGEDASRRYVDAHREATVIAWRTPRVDVRPLGRRAVIDGSPIL